MGAAASLRHRPIGVIVFSLAAVAALGIAAWSFSAGRTLPGALFVAGAICWVLVARDSRRSVRDDQSDSDAYEPDGDEVPDSRRASRRAAAPARGQAGPAPSGADPRWWSVVEHLLEPGELARRGADAARGGDDGPVGRGVVLLSNRAVYGVFAVGGQRPELLRIPIGAITNLARRPPRRLGVRFRNPNGEQDFVVVDLSPGPEEGADAFVRDLTAACRAQRASRPDRAPS
jgi:hypothetical protein